MFGKKTSLGRSRVPYSVEVHESFTVAKDGVSTSKSRWMSSMMSPTVGNVSEVIERGGVNQLPQKQNYRSF